MVDQLYPGKTVLPTVLLELVTQTETVLAPDLVQRRRTILGIDGHGGSQDNVHHLLGRGYHLHTKEYRGVRAAKLAESVTHWVDDPRHPKRQVGWVTQSANEYNRPIKRIAVRTRKRNGQWGIGVLISTRSAYTVGHLTGLTPAQLADPHKALLA